MNENNEVFTTYFSLNGSEENSSFLDMMNEISKLKSPFFNMMKIEHERGSITSQIISGKILKLFW